MEFLQKNARAIVIALLAVGIITVVASNSDNDSDGNDNQAVTSDSVESQDSETGNSVDNASGSEEGAESESGEQTQNVEKTDNEFTISALEGDNQTKLVRKVVSQYSDEKTAELSAEQKLYVETKLVNDLPKNDLIFIGDTIKLSEENVKARFDEAKALSDTQLASWAQYL